jgi:hypothetical protein
MLNGFVGVMDSELELRKMEKENRGAERDLLNPDAPGVLPEETTQP